MGKEVKLKCIEQDGNAFGFVVGNIYTKSKERMDNMMEDEMFVFNERGNIQLTRNKYFEEV